MPTILEEKDAIRELLARYCFHFDNGEFEEWVNLFTEDAVFDVGARGRFVGHETLRKFLHAIPLTNGVPGMKHCVMNSIVDVKGSRATAYSYVVVVQGGEKPSIAVAGRYEDQLTKVGTAWRFAERRVYLDLMGASS